MHKMGYEFNVIAPRINEPVLSVAQEVPPVPWAESLAYYKARSVSEDSLDAIVIGADTIVVHEGKIIGKAANESEARHILTNQFAGRVKVITGLAVICGALCRRIITHDETTLTIRAMTENEREEYLARGIWRGKAGAYAIQEGGDRFVESMEGSFANVVGLPTEKLEEVLSLIEGYIDRV